MKGALPISAESRRRWRMRTISVCTAVAASAIVIALAHFDGIARADDLGAAATRLSDNAFSMLNGINAQSRDGKPNPALGAVAIFAGDAQSLSRALAAGDSAGASSAMASLESDRAAVDSAAASNPGAINTTDWNGIKAQLAELSKRIAVGAVPPRAAAEAAASASAPTSTSSAIAPSAGAASAPIPPAAASAPLEPGRVTAAPRVVIDSRSADGTVIRVKGYLEGSGLRRAGIFQGSRELRDFKVGGIGGEQKLNFDIGVGSPPPDAVIRVYDADGRMAEAPIADAALAASSSSPDSIPPPAGTVARDSAGVPDVPEIPPMARSPDAPSRESGVEVFRNKGEGDSGLGGANTAEIPSHGTPRRSPSKRHTLSSHLGNVRISIIAANQIAEMPPTYEIIGQIQGRGVTRAGIYVGGRLAKTIAVQSGTDVTSFDERFVMNGVEASIRAYGVGDQFVESSIDLSTAMVSAGTPMIPGTMMPGTTYGGPMVGTPSGIVVQIAAVGPITPNLYVVSGVISGRSLSGAGLYQNGMLVQSIPVGGGGIGGMLGALIPGNYRNVNFNVRFNPQAGPATIRAFDSSGAYSEQPVMVAGMSPYGGVNPYGMNPYGSYGPGVTPYRPNPYAGGTFGAPPVSPYLPPTNPFASPPASTRPLW